MSKINIFLVDNSNSPKGEITLTKPKTYKELLAQLRPNLKDLPQYYEIFIFDKNSKEIKINNEKTYKMTEDILFIKETDKDILGKSKFEINYDRLSESKQNILDEKYNCKICEIIIKNEKPYLCYKCQNIFHEKCLKDWDIKCKSQHKNLMCPNCRNELPIERWNKKLNYEENRKDDANLINKINELKDNKMMQTKLIKKYEKYIEKTIEIFKNILNQINSIHNLMKLSNNNKLNYLINEYPLNIKNLINIDDIYDLINFYLEQFKNFIKKYNIIVDKNNNKFEKKKEKINEYRNGINLKYFVESRNIYNILGEKFVENNKNNIELIVNNKKSELINKCELNKGKNIITIIIKNKLINLSNMFNNCVSLNDIRELKFLDVSESKDFSYMFYKCSLLSDITALDNWNVSNGNNFEYMFSECPLLSNIKPLEKWDVSNGIDFGSMFYECSKLSDIKPLQYWNVSNSNYFNNMLRGCSLLSDIKPLENWNVSNCKDFASMFSGCKLLSDIKPLKNWNVNKGNDFGSMFYGCISLSNINPLQYWNVSNGKYFIKMFYGCISLSDVNPLRYWNVSNGENFSFMFSECSSLSDIIPLKNLIFTNCERAKGIFYNCPLIEEKSFNDLKIPALFYKKLISK